MRRRPLATLMTGLALPMALLAGCGFPGTGDRAVAERVDPSSTVEAPNPLAADPRFAQEPLTEEQLQTLCQQVAVALVDRGHEDAAVDPSPYDICTVAGAEVDGLKMFMSITRGGLFSEHDAVDLIAQDPPPTECELETAFNRVRLQKEPVELETADGYCYLPDGQGYSDAVFYSHSERFDVKTVVSETLDDESKYPAYNRAYTEQLMPLVFAAMP